MINARRCLHGGTLLCAFYFTLGFTSNPITPFVRKEASCLYEAGIPSQSGQVKRISTPRKLTPHETKILSLDTFSVMSRNVSHRQQIILNKEAKIIRDVNHHTMEKANVATTKKNSITIPKNDGPEKFFLPLAIIVIGIISTVVSNMGWTVTDGIEFVQNFISNPQATIQNVIHTVEAMGPLAPLYFGMFYFLAEILAIPATPLTMSAGYLFGLGEGGVVVLIAATLAASVSFFIGKTFLRSWVENILSNNPKLSKIDNAIGQQGFKLLFLIRLSPLFPFALSNYVYGASSISFPNFFWSTLFGFFPGTMALIYTGMVGKELTLGSGSDSSQPWYIYAAGFGVILTLLKLITDVASKIVNSIDDEVV